MAASKQPLKFSEELANWLNSPGRKTIRQLEQHFGEKSFAIAALLFMVFPALPLPTGGISHVLEIFTIIVCLGLVAGRSSIWVPERFEHREIGAGFQKKALTTLLRFINFIERFSRPRLAAFIRQRLVLSLMGLVMIAFTIAALLSPPFSGLDTLPAMGVVIIALSIILEDFLLFIIGTIAGSIGIVLILTIGAALFKGIGHLF